MFGGTTGRTSDCMDDARPGQPARSELDPAVIGELPEMARSVQMSPPY